MKKLLFLSLLTLTLFTACGWSEEVPEETPKNQPSQETPSVQTPEEPSSRQTPENNEVNRATPETESTLEPHPEQFDSIDKYVDLVLDSRTNTTYKTAEPKGMVMIRNITPEGVDSVRYELWGLSDWKSNEETDQNFYIKSYRSDPSTDQETITWFGPFKGKLSEKFLEKARENVGQES